MAKSQRYQTYMARFDRNGNHRGNDFPRRVLDEYAQRGPVDNRYRQVGGDQLDRPCGRPRRQLRGQSVVRAGADRRRVQAGAGGRHVLRGAERHPVGHHQARRSADRGRGDAVQQLAGRLPQGRCRAGTDPLQLLDLPIGLPDGTAERFDPATASWTKLQHPVIGTGMDYLGGFTDVQELPKGKAVTLQSRIALDAWMTEGNGRCGGDRRHARSPCSDRQGGPALHRRGGFNDSPEGAPADSVAVHGPQRTRGCGGGWCRQRVRHRQQRLRPCPEVGGGLMRHLSPRWPCSGLSSWASAGAVEHRSRRRQHQRPLRRTSQ